MFAFCNNEVTDVAYSLHPAKAGSEPQEVLLRPHRAVQAASKTRGCNKVLPLKEDSRANRVLAPAWYLQLALHRQTSVSQSAEAR